MIIKISLPILALLILFGCAHKPPPLSETNFHLTKKVIATLPSPKMNKSLSQQQLLTTEIYGKQFSFLSVLTINNQELNLLALTPLGVRLFGVTYNGKEVTVERFIPNIKLPEINDILGNIMLAYYSTNAWSGHLPEGWVIEDSKLQRVISAPDGKVILRIDYQKGKKQRIPIQINNYDLNYTISLKNLSE